MSEPEIPPDTGAAHVPSPRKNDVLFAVPVPSRAVPTVPEARLDAFNVVIPAPVPVIAPVTASEPSVPTEVSDEVTTLAASVVPVKVPAAAAPPPAAVCHVGAVVA